MRELGRILRTARESRGYDLDQIEAKTKIRKRYLLALEEGDWGVLPGRVYARGFVRSYAEVLGLDGLELLQTYVDGRPYEEDTEEASVSAVDTKATTPATPVSPVKEGPKETPNPEDDGERKPDGKMATEAPPRRTTQSERPEKSTHGRKGTGFRIGGAVGQVVIIVATLVVVGGGYLALRGHGHNGGSTAPKAHPAATNVANQTKTASASGSNRTSNVANTPANKVTVPKAPAVVITSKGLQNGSYTYTVQNVPNLDVTLNIQTYPCWIRVQADNKTVDPNDTVNPGQTRNFKAHNSVVLRLGNVLGVGLTVNGKKLTLPNTKSAVNVVIQKQGS